MPSPLLANGLVVADTPGFGAAQPGRADAETHAKVIVEYLNRLNARKDAFAQVYWVVRRGEGAIGSLEKRFYQEHLCGRCADVVVNYFGPEDGAHADPASQSKFRRRYGDCFDPLVRLHFLDGMQALEARKSNDAMALGSSGIQTLVDSMSAMAGNAYAHQAVRDVLAIWGDLHAALDRNLIDASRLWTIKKSRRDEAYYQAEQCGIPLKELDA
jgi:hypothetical protein